MDREVYLFTIDVIEATGKLPHDLLLIGFAHFRFCRPCKIEERSCGVRGKGPDAEKGHVGLPGELQRPLHFGSRQERVRFLGAGGDRGGVEVGIPAAHLVREITHQVVARQSGVNAPLSGELNNVGVDPAIEAGHVNHGLDRRSPEQSQGVVVHDVVLDPLGSRSGEAHHFRLAVPRSVGFRKRLRHDDVTHSEFVEC